MKYRKTSTYLISYLDYRSPLRLDDSHDQTKNYPVTTQRLFTVYHNFLFPFILHFDPVHLSRSHLNEGPRDVSVGNSRAATHFPDGSCSTQVCMIPILFSSPVHNAPFFSLLLIFTLVIPLGWFGYGLTCIISRSYSSTRLSKDAILFLLIILLHSKFLYSLILNQLIIMIYAKFNSIPVIVLNVMLFTNSAL